MTFSLRDFCEPGDEYVDYAADTREVVAGPLGSLWVEWDDSEGETGSARWNAVTDEQMDDIISYAAKVIGRQADTVS